MLTIRLMMTCKNSQRRFIVYSVARDESITYGFAKEKLGKIILIKPDNFLAFNAVMLLTSWENFSDTTKKLFNFDLLRLDLCDIYLQLQNNDLDNADKTLMQIKDDFPNVNERLLHEIFEDLKNFEYSQSSVKLFNEKLLALREEKAPNPLNLSQTRTEIIYPEEARKEKIEGRVTIKVLVGVDGNVIKIGTYEGNEVFKDVIVQAASKLKFTPAMMYGAPIKCWVTIPYSFALKKNTEKNGKSLHD